MALLTSALAINSRQSISSRRLRVLVTVIGTCVCLWIMWVTGKVGVSRLLTHYAIALNNLPAAEESIMLSPADAETHFARAQVLSVSGSFGPAVAELQRAVAIRPRDYFFWLQLGFARDQTGDAAGALSAFNEAVALAPYYAQPLWQRGNLLLRTGRYNEAFADLRRAAESDPDLVPNLIDLAWGFANGDPTLAEQLANVTTSKMRMVFAGFLARHGKAKVALEQFRQAGPIPDESRRELVQQLIASNAIPEAFEIWNGTHGSGTLATIYDGGFETAMNLDQSGLGWQGSRNLRAVALSLDLERPDSGSKSLRIDFAGDSDPASPILSQLVPVEAFRNYRINFAARTHDIVSGGLPLLVVSDVTGEKKPLGRSSRLGPGTSDWKMLTVELNTPPASNLILLSLQRENCGASTCPIFGSLWLDSFSIEHVN